MDLARRRKNIRTDWVLGAFAVFILVTSFPFWTGMFKLMTGGG
jgi:hypothetical protein